MKQAVVWSKSIGKLDRKLDKIYIINQTLMYGNLGDIAKLKEDYGENEVKEVFIKNPSQIYSEPAFNLIKNFILRIGVDLDRRRYIKSVY